MDRPAPLATRPARAGEPAAPRSKDAEPNEVRIRRMVQEFTAAMQRFAARLEAAGDRANAPPEGGGWSAAQIAYHVSLVNHAFAGLITGTLEGTAPAAAGFVERDWGGVVASIAPKLTAPHAARPPKDARIAEALPRLRASAQRLVQAIEGLTPERGAGFTLKSPIVGEISVYQIGDWATAHVIRHNAQAKRILGG